MTEQELIELIEISITARLKSIDRLLEELLDQKDNTMLKAKELAKMLQVSERTIRNWVKSKRIKCYWIGERQFFRYKDILALMQTNMED